MPDPDTPADQPDFLTPVMYHTLLALFTGPKHGYAISQEVAGVTEGRVTMGPGTLYGTLQRLADRGWAEPAEAPDDGGADGPHAERRRYHGITAEGRAVLRAETHRLAVAVRLARSRAVPEGS